MKVLIKPRAELVELFSKEHVKTDIRQLIEPSVDLIFYDEIKNDEILWRLLESRNNLLRISDRSLSEV